MISNLRQTTAVTLESCLQDVEARFLFNLPESELQQSDRLFFQIEQAWWFYEDFMADKYNYLPHFKSLKLFAETIFIHCPLLSKIHDKFDELFNDFGSYKNEIPVCGCILLSPDMTKIAIICTWNGRSWSFPRGKIDEGESSYQCAIRETYEETGYDARNNCNEEDVLVSLNDSKLIRLFIATNVHEDTIFIPQTRKEVSKVEFHRIDALPKSTYGIIPFIPRLKRWITKYSKSLQKIQKSPYRSHSNRSSILNTTSNTTSNNNTTATTTATTTNHKESRRLSPLPKPTKESRKQSPLPTNKSTCLTNTTTNTTNTNATNGTKRSSSNRHGSNSNGSSSSSSSAANNSMSVAFDGRNGETFSDEKKKGWNVNAMFEANSKLTGLKYEYDGNPHSFGSSHPRFVNYGTSSSTGSSSASSGAGSRATSFDYSNSNNNQNNTSNSSSSNNVNNSNNNNNENIVTNATTTSTSTSTTTASNSTSSTKKTPTRNLFNLPFVIDKALVMGTVDFYLLNGSTGSSV